MILKRTLKQKCHVMEVLIMTTSDAVGNDNFVSMQKFPFQWIWLRFVICHFDDPLDEWDEW